VPTLSRRRSVPSLLAVALLLGARTGDPAPPASGDADGTSLVVAVADEPTEMNPLTGYGEYGAAKVFDSLLTHDADLTPRPELAVAGERAHLTGFLGDGDHQRRAVRVAGGRGRRVAGARTEQQRGGEQRRHEASEGQAGHEDRP